MSNIAANAVDWYLNKLNQWHLLPTNGATMLRDIASKQLGDKNFTPRPLTIDNFTDAELDAIHSMALDPQYDKSAPPSYSTITGDRYTPASRGKVEYGDERRQVSEYLSPLRSVATTLGQAVVKKDGDDYVLTDTYDFNDDNMSYMKVGDKIRVRIGPKYELKDFDNVDQLKQELKNMGRSRKSLYSRIRNNILEYGHNNSDPDSSKIKTRLSMRAIRERLGDRLGKMDILRNGTKKDFVLRSSAAGALMGVPLGAALGAVSGAMLLIDKDKRKRWVKTMLTHVLGGAAIAAALGAAGGALASDRVYSSMEKKSGDKKDDQSARGSKIRKALIYAAAYGLPIAALVGMGAGVSGIAGGLTREVDDTKRLKLEEVKARWALDSTIWPGST